MNISRSLYNSIISEHFDIQDTFTRQTLLSLNEEDKSVVLQSLASKLYMHITHKVDGIDYGEIPKSKGDISKIPNFVQLKDCLEVIREIVIYNKQNPSSVDEVLKGIENLRSTKDIWEKAYLYKCALPRVFYENMALAVVASTSYLIATSIDFIKTPDIGIEMALDSAAYSKSKDAMLFKNLKSFNVACSKREIRKCMEPLLKVKNTMAESADVVSEISAAAVTTAISKAAPVVGVVVTVAGLITLAIPLLHSLVCNFYCIKQSASEYFGIQADLLALNAETVKLDYMKSEEERNKIYKKQNKIAEKLRKISNTLAVKLKSAEVQSAKMIKKETSEKIKFEDNGGSTLSMFESAVNNLTYKMILV